MIDLAAMPCPLPPLPPRVDGFIARGIEPPGCAIRSPRAPLGSECLHARRFGEFWAVRPRVGLKGYGPPGWWGPGCRPRRHPIAPRISRHFDAKVTKVTVVTPDSVPLCLHAAHGWGLYKYFSDPTRKEEREGRFSAALRGHALGSRSGSPAVALLFSASKRGFRYG